MITDLLMTVGALGGLVIAVWIGRLVYLQEFNGRCGWCFGTAREWGAEFAPGCPACGGTGRVSGKARAADGGTPNGHLAIVDPAGPYG